MPLETLGSMRPKRVPSQTKRDDDDDDGLGKRKERLNWWANKTLQIGYCNCCCYYPMTDHAAFHVAPTLHLTLGVSNARIISSIVWTINSSSFHASKPTMSVRSRDATNDELSFSLRGIFHSLKRTQKYRSEKKFFILFTNTTRAAI